MASKYRCAGYIEPWHPVNFIYVFNSNLNTMGSKS